MKAMIFAAGLGTRLRPLTLEKPKALVEVNGKPLLQQNLEKLQHYGYSRVVVNVHYFSHQLVSFLEQYDAPDLEIIISDESEELLDTGGGLKQAAPWLDGEEPVLVCNVDVLSDLDLDALRNFHLQQGGLATLAVRKRETSRYLLFEEGQLCGWKNEKTGEVKMSYPAEKEVVKYAFSGIQMLDPRIFSMISEEGVFSTIPMYLRLAATEKIVAYPHDTGHWMDVGRIEHLERAHAMLQKINLF